MDFSHAVRIQYNGLGHFRRLEQAKLKRENVIQNIHQKNFKQKF